MSRDSRAGRSNNTRTTAKAKGRKESFPGQRNPPPPRRLLHETGTGGPVHVGVVYGESLEAETGPQAGTCHFLVLYRRPNGCVC